MAKIMIDDLGYWLALARFPKFGAVRIKRLSESFPTMREAFAADADALVAAGIDAAVAEAFIVERSHLNPEHELDLLRQHGVDAVTRTDPRYPPALKTIHDPPAILFVRGALPHPDRMHLAVVGTRHPSRYGLDATQALVAPVAREGVVIVSGMALGIDGAAHTAALEASGTTLAVLGAGLDEDNIYPAFHRTLASRIVAGGGALISEFPIGTHVLKQNFPFRNRIIAGLSKATLVIEAAAKSGSLITARTALEENREVFAVPGPIDSPHALGPNNLIKSGEAALVASADDILFALGLRSSKSATVAPTSPQISADSAEEAAILNILSREPLHMDEIIRASGLSASVASSTLTLMEMKGSARHIGGKQYVRG